jgi:hypothetical protein
VIEPYKFQAMLGPPEDWPVGSVEWAERMGQRLQIALDRVGDWEIPRILPVIEAVLDAEPPPWTVWPAVKPARTPERWFEIVTGEPIDSVVKLIEAYQPGSPLIRRLQVTVTSKAQKKGERRWADGPSKRRGSGPNTLERLLARLARDRPDILDGYKKGKYQSVRAAARAAGLVKNTTPLDHLRRAWKKADLEQRAQFLKEVAP